MYVHFFGKPLVTAFLTFILELLMKKYLLGASLLLGSTVSFADVRVTEIRKVIVSFSEEQAKVFAGALGLQDKLSDSVTVEPSTMLSLKAEVRGFESNGSPYYRYSGQVVLDTSKLSKEDGTIKATLAAQAANKLFSALKGVKAKEVGDGVEKTFVKTVSFDNFKVSCGNTPRGFIPFECKIEVQLPDSQE